MRITRKHDSIIYNCSINSTPIEEVQATKYIGLTINTDLSWYMHVINIAFKLRPDQLKLSFGEISSLVQLTLS